MDMAEFVRAFAEDAPVVDLSTVGERASQHVIVKWGRYEAVLELRGQGEHLCIDVHPFVDGRDARAAAWGMEEGRRVAFDEAKTDGTSHGWPASRLVAVLVGEQS